jgi:hypothetical protein
VTDYTADDAKRDNRQQLSDIYPEQPEAQRRHDRLAAYIDTLTTERDLALAHDTQPYPTVWAYEQMCKTRDRLTAERDELLRWRRSAKETIDSVVAENKRLTASIHRGISASAAVLARGDSTSDALDAILAALDTKGAESHE